MTACDSGGPAEVDVDAQQARELLGVGPDAGQTEIQQAYDLARERASTEHSPVKAYAVISELNAALDVLEERKEPPTQSRVQLPSRRSIVRSGLAVAAAAIAAGTGMFVYDKFTAPGPPPGLLGVLNTEVIAQFSGVVSSLTFSPDGRTLATSSTGIGASFFNAGGYLWDISELSHASLLSQIVSEETVSPLTFSTDGRSVAGIIEANVGSNSTLGVWDSRTGKQTLNVDTTRTDPGASLICLAFSPDGKLVACGSQSGDIHLVNVANHSDLALPSGVVDQVEWLAYQPDGTLAFLTAQDSTLRFAPFGGVAAPSPVPLPDSQGGVAMSPNGASVVGLAADGSIQLTTLATAKTTVTGHVIAGQSSNAAFSPDISIVGVTNDDSAGSKYTLTLWDVPTGRQTLTLTGQWPDSGGTSSMAINYAKTVAAVGNGNGVIHFWDISKR